MRECENYERETYLSAVQRGIFATPGAHASGVPPRPRAPPFMLMPPLISIMLPIPIAPMLPRAPMPSMPLKPHPPPPIMLFIMPPRLPPIIEAHVAVTRHTAVEAAHHGVLRGIDSGSTAYAPAGVGSREVWANASLLAHSLSPALHEGSSTTFPRAEARSAGTLQAQSL